MCLIDRRRAQELFGLCAQRHTSNIPNDYWSDWLTDEVSSGALSDGGPMSQATPRLITFAASHFCEKARWALDWHGIAYDEIGWPPGLTSSIGQVLRREGEYPSHFLDGDRSFREAAPSSIGQRARLRIPAEALTQKPASPGSRRSNGAPMRSSLCMCAVWHLRSCSQATHISSNRRFSIERRVGVV